MGQIEATAKKAFFLTVLISIVAPYIYAGASVDSLQIPSQIPMEGDFRITALLSGDTCGAQARFYVDGRFINSNALPCGRRSTDSDLINPYLDGFSCGPHTLTVQLLKDDEVIANYSVQTAFGNMPVMEVYNGPVDSREATIRFYDNQTGKPLAYLKTRIYNVRKGTKSGEWHTTDAEGKITYYSRDTGQYKLVISDSDYCGELFFYIKRPLYYDGPFPREPTVGDLISMAVPAGVGVKVYDSAGALYLIAMTSITGGVNYTINESGNYTVVIGDEESLYGSSNISLYVAAKASDSLTAVPEKAVLGESVTLKLTADGKPVENATLSVEDPDGFVEDVSTGRDGIYKYFPESAGVYKVSFTDPKHLGARTTFEARGSLKLDYTPMEPEAGSDINIHVRDQTGNLVGGATVSVKDVAYGLTGPDGRYTFRVPDGRRYTAVVTKEGYWDASIDFVTIAPLYLEIMPEEIELGESVRAVAFDSRRKQLDAELSAVGPDGLSVSFNGSYTPIRAGRYFVYAAKKGYISANDSFTVRQRPLELSLAILRDRVVVNTTSRGTPVGNITLYIEKDSGRERMVTDRFGSASFRIRNDGRIRISANPNAENPDYAKISVVRNIVKMHDFSSLIASLSAVALVALIAIAVVYAAPRRNALGRPPAAARQRSVSARYHSGGRTHSALSGHGKSRSRLAGK